MDRSNNVSQFTNAHHACLKELNFSATQPLPDVALSKNDIYMYPNWFFKCDSKISTIQLHTYVSLRIFRDSLQVTKDVQGQLWTLPDRHP